MRRPPKILHKGKRPSYWKDMVSDCCYNLRLSGRETSLLTYYCDQANLFRPSLKEISKKTSIPTNKISVIRSWLINKGLITYSHNIEINWYKIRNFAMIPRLSKKAALHGSFTQVHVKEPTLKSLAKKYWDEDAIDWKKLWKEKPTREYTEQEIVWIKTIESMTEHEYADILMLIRKLPDAPKNCFTYVYVPPK